MHSPVSTSTFLREARHLRHIVSRTQFCATFAKPTASIDVAWGG